MSTRGWTLVLFGHSMMQGPRRGKAYLLEDWFTSFTFYFSFPLFFYVVEFTYQPDPHLDALCLYRLFVVSTCVTVIVLGGLTADRSCPPRNYIDRICERYRQCQFNPSREYRIGIWFRGGGMC